MLDETCRRVAIATRFGLLIHISGSFLWAISDFWCLFGTYAFFSALGRLWLAGVRFDWSAFYEPERRLRVPLPTYPFERQRHWIDAPRGLGQHHNSLMAGQGTGIDVFNGPSWVSVLNREKHLTTQEGPWVMVVDPASLGADLAMHLQGAMAAGTVHLVRSVAGHGKLLIVAQVVLLVSSGRFR